SRNTITFNRGASLTSTQYHAGILLQSCTGAHVTGGDNNTDPDIQNDIEVATIGVTGFRGIDIENSPDVRLNCNIIKNISNSFVFTGDCFGTLMRKNYLENFEVGINNFHSILDNQGWYTGSIWEKLNNQWVDASSTQFRVGGIIDQPFNWYHQSGSTYTPSPHSFNVTLLGSSTGNPPCNDYTPQMRDELYGKVIGDSLNFNYFNEENTYLVKTSAFERMKRDTSILNEGRSTDTDFQNYFLLNDSTNIGILSEVRVLSLDSLSIDEAIDANEAIDDEIGIETYMKTVYGIYLNTIAVGLPLSATDSSTLELIALKTWIEAGKAIYIAASMLGMEIHPAIPELRLSANSTSDSLITQPNKNQILIHPNPAANSLTVSGLENKKSVLQIFDMQGKLVFNEEVMEDTTIDISKLIIGVYRINVIANGISSSFKFIKLKY
nr:T9SS type A sorting domain-containing protein [Bacteroidia bacterium]